MWFTRNSSDHFLQECCLVRSAICDVFQVSDGSDEDPLKDAHHGQLEPELRKLLGMVDPSATVLEIGAGAGRVTCALAHILKNSGKLLSVEPVGKVPLISMLTKRRCGAFVLKNAVVGAEPSLLYYPRPEMEEGVEGDRRRLEELAEPVGQNQFSNNKLYTGSDRRNSSTIVLPDESRRRD